jgi:MFS superfamily sulfate permease-like transporter
VLIILFLSALAVHVPLVALAAILFVVAWNMSEARTSSAWFGRRAARGTS